MILLVFLHRLKMVRSMLALTKRMAWSASTTTPKNTTIQQCSTKLIKRWGRPAPFSSLGHCISIVGMLCYVSTWHYITFLLSDVEMYRAGRETKVYGSRNHSKPTICAEGETVFNNLWSHNKCYMWFHMYHVFLCWICIHLFIQMLYMC